MTLNEAQVSSWRTQLTEVRAQVLLDRGITSKALTSYEIGWDGDRYTIPVRDRAGDLVNVRLYSPTKSPKMLNTKGHGSPTRLMFADRLPDQPSTKYLRSFVVVAGGEWDAIATTQAGFVAVCSSNGEGAVPADDELEPLRNWPVAVVLDADNAGRAAALKWAEKLVGIASVVKVVHLPEGKDLNEWFAEQGKPAKDLMSIVHKTPEHGRRRDAAELLRAAVAQQEAGTSRNEAGFWLCCQLRDERYGIDEAREILREYVAEVGTRKSPPYTMEEAESSLHQAFSRPPRGGTGQTTHGFLLTDVGNAERLVDQHGDDIRWVPKLGRWAVWTGKRWDTYGDLAVESWAKHTARSILREAAVVIDEKRKDAITKHALRSESAGKVRAMVDMARSEPGIAISPSVLASKFHRRSGDTVR